MITAPEATRLATRQKYEIQIEEAARAGKRFVRLHGKREYLEAACINCNIFGFEIGSGIVDGDMEGLYVDVKW